MRAAPGATRADARGSERNARWTASLPFPARPAPPRSRPDPRHEAPACGPVRRAHAAARQIAHGAHLQRRPLALGLAAIGLRTALLPVAARPIAVRSIIVPHIVAGALAIRPGPARAGADALLGRALPFVRRGGGLGGAARVGAAAQALRLGHGLELVIQLGAQMLGGFGGRFPAHGMKCRQENDNGRFPNQEPAVARLPYTPDVRWREPGRNEDAQSSLVSSAVGTNSAARLTTPWFSRTRFSISIASSRCSFRYSRTLSLPWPMRLPL